MDREERRDRAHLRHRWLAHHPHAGQRHRIHCGSGGSPPRSGGELGQRHRPAQYAFGRRHHCQGSRARAGSREPGALAAHRRIAHRDLEEVGERQADHRVIPPAPIAERLAPVPDPLETYARVSHLPHPIFLDSAERGRRGRYSFVAADPVAVIRSRGDAGALGAVLDALGGAHATPFPGLPPFQGGAAGCIAYEWGSTLERLPPLVADDLGIPDVLLGIYDWVIAWDHEEDAAWIVSRGLGGRDPARRLAAVRALLATATPPADRGPSRPGVHRPGTR